MNHRAIVLFSHGSRDPLWRTPMEAVAAHIGGQHPGRPVACAYLELCTPTLAQATDQLVAQGAAHPAVRFHVQPAIGEDPRMTALMAEIACEVPSAEIP